MPGLPSCRGGDGEHHPSRRADGKEKRVDGGPTALPRSLPGCRHCCKAGGSQIISKIPVAAQSLGKAARGPRALQWAWYWAAGVKGKSAPWDGVGEPGGCFHGCTLLKKCNSS